MNKKVVIVPVKIRMDWVGNEDKKLDKRCCRGICELVR